MLTLRQPGLYTSQLFSEIPGILHGFTGRKAGDMRKDESNRRRFLSSLGSSNAIITVHQVHSNIIHTVDSGGITSIPDADGIVSRGFKEVLAIFTADCVPILLAENESGVIAAVHAGWRGVRSGIVRTAIDSMRVLGADISRIKVAIGPHIGVCCYSVGDDVTRQFKRTFTSTKDWLTRNEEGIWFLSLAGCIRQQLLESGINHLNIDGHPICTSCRVNDFFSYRRDTKESYGEMMAFIARM